MSRVSRLLDWVFHPLILSFLLLIAAWILAPLEKLIPDSFYGLWRDGPWVVLSALAALGIVYRRGKAVLVAMLLAFGLFVLEHPTSIHVLDQHLLRAVLVTIIVPLNLVVVGWVKERGVFTIFGVSRLAFILFQVAVLTLCWHYWPQAMNHYVGAMDVDWLKHQLTSTLHYPQFAYLIMIASAASLLAFAVVQPSHFAFGLFAGCAGYVIAALIPEQAARLHADGIAVGLILCIAILRDAYNMAYQDELTGLPQRRSLNELCMSLSGDYAAAMLDVDHFKKFNDKYGHDTGDDVLKMVASQIAKVRDGGRAFRFGGEEFTIVYPSKVKEQALRSLEAVRKSIEGYEMVIRPPRHDEEEDPSTIAKRGKGATPDATKVSVTISIGVADREDRNDTPDDVIKKADQALYGAKKAGRNQVVMWTETLAG